MLNKDYPGNESFTITLLTSIILNEILISAIKFLEGLLNPQGYIAL